MGSGIWGQGSGVRDEVFGVRGLGSGVNVEGLGMRCLGSGVLGLGSEVRYRMSAVRRRRSRRSFSVSP